jgi:hypothetical protein
VVSEATSTRESTGVWVACGVQAYHDPSSKERVDVEAAIGAVDGRGHDLCEVHRSELLQRIVHSGQRAGHTDRRAARHGGSPIDGAIAIAEDTGPIAER